MGDDGRGNGDKPGVILPPPLPYALALAAGLLANRRYPILFLPRPVARVLGPTLILGGLAVGVLASRELRRARTNVDPYHPTTAIVTEGPYRYTRNPIYVGFTLVYTGVSALANAFLPILLLPAVQQLMRRGVIEREERYLERKFGDEHLQDEYLQYKERVRRWI